MRYTSSFEILGSPLIDIRVADPATPRGVARGWIALGDIAIGHLIAVGGLAVGAIAFGGLAVGIIPIAGLALGIFAVGGGAIGIWAVGGGALALHAALGGLAVAGQFAIGGAAFAPHANDAEASRFLSSMPFSVARYAMMHARWLILLAALPLLPALRPRR
ncbi:MAG TPA: hypothetical protein VLV78_17390 [Thermoanaerobaculia bacterium]|nr:hypothetical protein [Thermoanaerobaculia bacterium]